MIINGNTYPDHIPEGMPNPFTLENLHDEMPDYYPLNNQQSWERWNAAHRLVAKFQRRHDIIKVAQRTYCFRPTPEPWELIDNHTLRSGTAYITIHGVDAAKLLPLLNTIRRV